MTKSAKMKLNLKTKILKIAKGLNKFTLPDILPMVEEKESTIHKILADLETENKIKKISKNEYLYTNLKGVSDKPSKPQIIKSPKSNKADDIWLTIAEVARLLNIQEESVKRNCLRGSYIVKPNKEPDLEGKYLIKRSSLKLYEFLEDSERRAMNKEVEKLFHNKIEERLYTVSSDRGKSFLYRYLKLFKLTEGMNCKELRNFLEIIPLKNPKLKVSYSSFYAKKKKYQEEGIMAIFPKYFMPDNKNEEPEVRRNLNRLPKVYNLATTEQIEIIYKCFCFGIPASQTAKIANMGNTTTETFYQYIRAKIFDKQYQELSVHFDSDPQCPQIRVFMKDVPIYIYCYEGRVYVARKPINTNEHIRRQQPEEVREARRMYNILYRKKFMASMRKYLDHHLAVFLWKECICNYDEMLNSIYSIIHI